MQNVSMTCANCEEDAKCRRRDFSEQAWTVLALWNEVQATAIDQPICEDCYNELREVLIDRADEIEVALSEPAPKKSAQAGKRAAAPARQKVRKAG
jgi:uncharacterized protein with PIN domain